MKILRLATSDDGRGRLPPGGTIPEVVASILEEATGEPVHITTKAPWPKAGVVDLVERWVNEVEPDMVLLSMNSIWFNYPSVPLLLERKFGRAGKKATQAGIKVGETPWVNRSPIYRYGRRALVNTIGGATHFTAEEVVATMRDVSRRILAREGVGLVIFGPFSRLNYQYTRKRALEHERNRLRVHNAMKAFAKEVHVPFFGQDTLPSREELAATVGPDGIHLSEFGARQLGEQEAAAFLELWNQLHAS